ncbi:MAG: 50S ribosomal protein L17 [Firmicutes bacterium]|nr:50S ribosomal protein L17 [Bacillota bacterium]MCL5038972.1 50S ribosomal protein L17 [Bacillota bacterium]
MPRSRLGRPTDQREAMLRNLVTSFLDKEKLETTETRAMEVQQLAEHMITLAKENTLHARRRALAVILNEGVVKKLFETIGPRYADKNGGYTRILLLSPRRGDAAPMSRIELV